MSSTTSPARRSSRAKRSGANTAPVNFDPATHPILSRHWFGIEPLHPIGQIAAEIVADLRFRRKVQRLHRLGDRVLDEFLAEIGAERGITTIIERKVERYVALDPKALKTLGGDRFPPLPIRVVQQP